MRSMNVMNQSEGSLQLTIADKNNHRINIRKVNLNGTITTVAGNGTAAYGGDGGPSTNAVLFFPTGVFLDVSGNILIADYWNNRIRKVAAAVIKKPNIRTLITENYGDFSVAYWLSHWCPL
jgi:hypothetical protein